MFAEDKFVNGELVYLKGEIYEIEGASVARWLKRGGVIVDYAGSFEEATTEAQVKPVELEQAPVQKPVEKKNKNKK